MPSSFCLRLGMVSSSGVLKETVPVRQHGGYRYPWVNTCFSIQMFSYLENSLEVTFGFGSNGILYL